MYINQSNIKFNGLNYGNNPNKIIIHNADHPNCSVYDVDRWHKGNGWSGIGYHYFIRKDGSVWTGRPENAKGAHTIGQNSSSIGICLEGALMREKPTRAQLNSLYYLISDIRARRGNLPVYGHKDFNNTDCPGINFPLEQFKNNSYRPTGGTEISDNGFYRSDEERTNATIVGEGNIEVLDKNCKVIENRYISSLDRVFVLGIYPASKHIEIIYPAGNEKYHAYISIENYSRISFDYHMQYKNDNGITYVWWDSEDVNVKEHNEELQPNQKASPMYRVGKWLRVTFYRTDGTPSDGFVRYEGEQSVKFYEDEKIKDGIVKVNTYLNVRDSINGNIIGKVFNGEEVSIIWTKDGWYYIEYNTNHGKKRGYVSSKYVEEV
ncbi:TPA: SH3 domain-containing protein [Clostridium perfringens]|uniref:SH3 domain-containing protein n=1 Tax=Clostridium perfringens TaxID=1502 RepID=A0AAN5NEA8_CLOPF|nr:N-acetylmuramoyl-L-alanine amidase [Clostridium perfringens]AQW26539.1 N-acetylmuramoyl-L-alanine amidase [Clostridium perfringens]EJT6502944.1 N-acetylmuramoyl-L-alanine amidase [Clostridium perfringens]HAT4299622.1 SH3 domain-containing protein [Clostridium perfringens]